jgi:mRNA-degrading endonuclease RelE of RelBE toxin-antitoxin system
MFQLFITSSAKRSAKRLPRQVREEVIAQSEKLKENPYLGEKLTGPLHFLYSLHIKMNNIHYRVAYTVDAEQKRITVYLIGPREGFYQRLTRLLK